MRFGYLTVLVAAVFASSALATSDTADIGAIGAIDIAQPPDTPTLYRIHCQMCHGAEGKAPIPEMAFVGREWKHGTKSVEMAKVIADGVVGTPMMPFKGKLTPAQITSLARHVRAFDKRLAPEKSGGGSR
jgi:mono/diheme cytochrome c family protein